MNDTNSALTTEQVRDACRRLERAWDSEGLSALMTRYLIQPLSDSETAWAYMNLANAHAWGGRPVQSVSAHEAFEGWLPGRTPKLSFDWPHYPPAEDSAEPAFGPDEIRLMFLGQSVEFATAYGATGRYRDFVAKVDAALTGLKPTKDNLELRFYAVRIFLDASQVVGDFVRADRYVRLMHSLADDAEHLVKATELHATTLLSEIQLARAQSDIDGAAKKIQHALSLLADADNDDSKGGPWLRGFRHGLALHLIQSNRHELALPLLELIAATGDHFGGGFGWLMHAAAVWRVTRDRSRTLGLLRVARANDGRDLTDEFRALPGFGEVREDPEFLQAISRSAVR